jgi:hypothetical protein
MSELRINVGYLEIMNKILEEFENSDQILTA